MREEPQARPPGEVDALRLPIVWRYLLGRSVANLGTHIMGMATSWLIYDRTHSAWSLGLVGLCILVPTLLFMIPAGNIADSFPRRNVALVAGALQALIALGLAAVAWLDAPMPLLFVLLAALSAGRTFFAPAANGILAQMLSGEQYARAAAWQGAAVELTTISGPAIAGLLIGARGTATPAYLSCAAGHVFLVAMLWTLPTLAPERKLHRSAKDVFAGIAFIGTNPIFRAAILLDLFAVLLGGAIELLPVFAKDILSLGPQGLGWLRAAPAIGAFSMAVLAARLPPWQRPGRTLLLTVMGFGVATIAFGLARNLALALFCLFFIGVFDQISVIIRMTLARVITPEALRGRVLAAQLVFISLSNDLGRLESGATTALWGPVVSVVGGGIGTLLVVALVALRWPQLARLGPLHTLKPEGS